jgi:hypothetical protein
MTTTVALHSQIYDLLTAERKHAAQAWIKANLGDTSRFTIEFPEAQILASVLNGQRGPIHYHVEPGAADLANGWEPDVRVVFARPDGSSGVALRHFSHLGSFRTYELAREASRGIELAQIQDDDVIVFAHERK